MAIEIVEFEGLNAKPVQARFFDPGGTITLNLVVPDLEAVKTRLLRIKGLEWINASQIIPKVTVRDPDGIFVSLAQPSKLTPNVVLEVGLVVTVGDVSKTVQFYSEALEFTDYGGGMVRVPGDEFPVNFTNPNYVEAKPVHSEIHDPGSGVLRLRVSDFDAAVQALKAHGATVVSAGGEPVNLGRNRAIILRDINNLFIQVLESAPAAGKGPTGK